jgi:hypothetical protein
LGDLVTTTSRIFIVGRTGLGKTMFGLAMACGIASGAGFLHWRSTRRGKVLLIDGEMPGELIKSRAIDALRRVRMPPHPDNLLIYSRDIEEEIGRRIPSLGTLAPLNTTEGMRFVLALIDAIGGVDVVIFDNVMSLVAGDQKDEVPWSETLPLVDALTARRIGQVWLDHTGHDSSRQYGSATKAWRFDAVGQMTPLPDDQRQPGEMAFNLSFEPPHGKARRRTPDNSADFETCIMRLRDDQWTSEAAGTQRQHVTPKAKLFHDAMLYVLASGDAVGPGKVSRASWMSECVRRSLIEPPEVGDTGKDRARKAQPFRKAAMDLQAAHWIAADGDTFADLTRRYPTGIQ